MPILFHDTVKKEKQSSEALKRLRVFLDQENPELVYFLHHLWDDQQKAITYKELREYILLGDISTRLIDEWQQDYSRFAVKHMEPLYEKAIQAATEELRTRFPGVFINYAQEQMQNYTKALSARFVTNSTNDQIMGVRQVVKRAVNLNELNVDTLARAIRPMVGLNLPQARANMNYFESLIDSGISKRKALDKSLRYAARQHRYRGYMISRTEMAFAYNNGEHQGVKEAQKHGMMGKTIKRWCSADDDRVCKVCKALEGTDVEMDGLFDYKTKLPNTTRLNPPAHPHCRCTVLYIEKEPPKYGQEFYVNPYHEKMPNFTEPSDRKDAVRDETKLAQISDMARKADSTVAKYIQKESKWSGNVAWNSKTETVAAKNWNCDILVRPEVTLHSLIHEHLHARSISYFNSNTYVSHIGFEELAVEFFAREISKTENVEITYVPAYNLVEELYYINHTLRLANTNLEFAKMLLMVPLPERKEWLRRQIIEYSDDFTTYNDLMRKLEGFDKWKG